MAEPKTRPTGASVDAFIASLDDPIRRQDSQTLIARMSAATGAEAVLWGPNIVGFGQHTIRYASGRTGDWFEVGFSPRKRNLVLYIMPGFSAYADLLARLGRHRTGASCLYLTRLAKVDMDVLDALIVGSVAEIRGRGE